ncbi:DUF58 domain-containing protein [Oceanobacillus saliphilus]|uniref:DUF58 domain-containing protein n=1 Tax=Oceanobacillus saliphilus TaxID=2925834 RepID=UPI00201D6006|nr:DUF58 domain-containing protein [Oceanobacillus saliphilus]
MKGSLRVIGNVVFVFALFVVLFSYAMFQGGFVSWFLFFSFLPIFIYHIGFLMYPLKKWKVTRDISHHIIEAGDSISATIKIERSLPFPLYYCIIEEVFPPTLMTVDNRKDKYQYMNQPYKLNVDRRIKKVIFPLFKRTLKIPYAIQHVPRGEHRLQRIRIRTGDIFGFLIKEHLFEVSDEIIAYPNRRKLKLVDSFSSYEQGSVASNSQNLSNTNIAVGIREYAPGDRFSWIDWKQTARKNTMMTKEFEQEKRTDILIVHDSCHFEGINPLAFEATIEVCVSLMEAFRKQDNQAGLLSIGEKTVYFTPEHRTEKSSPVNQHLTRLQPSGDLPFSVKVKQEIMRMDKGDFVIFITTHLDEFLKQTIQQFKQRTKYVAVIFIQSSELISDEEHHLIQQLRYANVGIQLLTEKQLGENRIEVEIG